MWSYNMDFLFNKYLPDIWPQETHHWFFSSPNSLDGRNTPPPVAYLIYNLYPKNPNILFHWFLSYLIHWPIMRIWHGKSYDMMWNIAPFINTHIANTHSSVGRYLPYPPASQHLLWKKRKTGPTSSSSGHRHHYILSLKVTRHCGRHSGLRGATQLCWLIEES